MKTALHFEVLDEARVEVFKELTFFVKYGYYLAGGTALALQIGHRKSYDFDLFNSREISLAVKSRLIKLFKNYSLKTLVDTSDELTVALNDGIKITLLNYYWPPIKNLIINKNLLPLLSIKEIAAAKAYAIGRRGNYRDYFDLYVILKNKLVAIKEIVKICENKYSEAFSQRMFLEQLLYLDDIAEDNKLMFLGEKYLSAKELSKYFKSLIRKM